MKLLVCDDFFPNRLSAFRLVEYNFYLERFADCTISSFSFGFDDELRDYKTVYPAFAERVKRFEEGDLYAADMVYINFLSNAHLLVPMLEAANIPFIFCLYPGGAFCIGDTVSNSKLDRVMSSPLLRGVIVTQKLTMDYLLRRYGVRIPMKFIFGTPAMMPDSYTDQAACREYFGEGKKYLDICFVAMRYTTNGDDKGLPDFIKAAEIISRKIPEARFHLVGNWPKINNIDVDIATYGTLIEDDLKRFYLGMDIIISPNKPFKIANGAFDGFPTASCFEASLGGVVMMVSDPLGMNNNYLAGNEIILIRPDERDISRAVLDVVGKRGKLGSVGRQGRLRSLGLFSSEVQLEGRSEFITEVYAAHGA